MYIAPLDDKTRRRLLKAVADRGQAAGIEAAAKVIEVMASHKGRVVGTNDLRNAVAAMRERAAEIRATADAEIAAMEAESA